MSVKVYEGRVIDVLESHITPTWVVSVCQNVFGMLYPEELHVLGKTKHKEGFNVFKWWHTGNLSALNA